MCGRSEYANSVRKTAECIFNDGALHGGWNSEFRFLAGCDCQMTFQQWAARVGATHASYVAFMVIATQEGHHADRPDAIDADDWIRFMSSAERAVPGQMHAAEFGDYVAARATAELIFEVADGKTGLDGSQWSSICPSGHKLTTAEWAEAYHYVAEAAGRSWWDWRRAVTPQDMTRAVGLSDVADVFPVFEFFEAVGSAACPRHHSWQWLWSHPDPLDGHEIDQCEWNQLVPQLQESLRKTCDFCAWATWDGTHGISAGLFAEVVAAAVTAYFDTHTLPGR